MRAFRTIRLRLRSLLRGRVVEQELDEELRGHLERQIELHRARGLSAAEARAAALREFGNVPLIEDQCRDTRSVGWIEDLTRDTAYAVRSMRRSPGHTAVAVLSLAFAIGANTAIFSIVNTLMLRSLPVAEPQELVEIGRATSSGPGNFSHPLYERVRDQTTTFSGVLAVSSSTIATQIGDSERLAIGRFVSGNFFELLGIRPAVGRLLSPRDDLTPEGRTVAVIAHGLWQRSFGGDPHVVGRTLRVPRIGLDPVPFTIVGVLPQAFDGLVVGRVDDFYLPMASEPLVSPRSLLNADTAGWLKVVGRLAPGISPEAAGTELDVIYARYVDDTAPLLGEGLARGLRMARLTAESARAGLSAPRNQFARPVLLLMGAVALVLLIACANVINLLLARALARRREVGVRLALGASRGRIVRQLLAESSVLGVIGGALGLMLAFWGTGRIATLMANEDPTVAFDLSPDIRVLIFTTVVSLAAAVVSGLVPALRLSRTSAPTPHDEVRVAGVSRSMTLWSRALVSSQVALSLLLLAGALLLVTTLRNFRTLDFGFDRHGVLTMRLEAARAGYTGERRLAYFQLVLDRARSVPDVRAAALSLGLPVMGAGVTTSFSIEGQPADPDEQVFVNEVSDGYFATTGTALMLGRDFGPQDRPDSTPVAIINDALAQRYFNGRNPIGQYVRAGRRGVLEVVGVVETTKYQSLREERSPIVYAHALQAGSIGGGLILSVKAATDPAPVAATIRRELESLAPVRVTEAMMLSAQIDRTLLTERLIASMLGGFAALALLLAVAGLYAVLAYMVSRRTGEIGVRLALGASRGAVFRPVLVEAATVVGLGITVGIPAAMLLTGLLSSLLYGVSATDGWVLGGVVLCLTAAGLVAASVPAWRASRIDPLIAIRWE